MSDLVAANFGARGSGKSTRVKRWLERHRPKRVLIWDTMDEYRGHAQLAPSLTAMLAAASSNKEFRLRYVPRGTDDELTARFEAFCALAYSLGGLVMVVEELQRVTRPSWAPASWSDCTLRGRHQGLAIFGISQRPASVDKNFFSQATVISTGRLLFIPDVTCMASILGVPPEWIMGLPDFEHLELDTKTGALSHVDAAAKVTELARPAAGASLDVTARGERKLEESPRPVTRRGTAPPSRSRRARARIAGRGGARSPQKKPSKSATVKHRP